MSLLITLYDLEIKILSLPWRELEVWIPYYSSYIEIYNVISCTHLNESLPQPCTRVWTGPVIVIIWTSFPSPPLTLSVGLFQEVLDSRMARTRLGIEKLFWLRVSPPYMETVLTQ